MRYVQIFCIILFAAMVAMLSCVSCAIQKPPVSIMKITPAEAQVLQPGHIGLGNVDYTCVRDCVSKGYLYGYCESVCSW